MSGITYKVEPTSDDTEESLTQALAALVKLQEPYEKMMQSCEVVKNIMEQPWFKQLGQPPSTAANYPHLVIKNPSSWAEEEISETFFSRIVNNNEIRFTPSSVQEYRDVIAHLRRMKEMEPGFEYIVSPQAPPVTAAPSAPAAARTGNTSSGRYPSIVVNHFPNSRRHIKNIQVEFGRGTVWEALGNGFLFIPEDGDEYHDVLGYLQRMEATEPSLKYFVRPLKVVIRGLPRHITVSSVKAACQELGYEVDQVKKVATLYSVMLFGGKDETSILGLSRLFGYNIQVEIWRGR